MAFLIVVCVFLLALMGMTVFYAVAGDSLSLAIGIAVLIVYTSIRGMLLVAAWKEWRDEKREKRKEDETK